MNYLHESLSLSARRQRGLSLIEILVSLMISLFLIAGVIQLFISSKQTYRSYDALSRLQENGRFALEAMSRDVRMAGFTGCPRVNPAPVFSDCCALAG
jgi:type IV pilus assembly protein PilW